ncbi:MAG: DUF393 domain-containing protein [Bacteroidetes bacterium]|nr:DUF393 domain-containing protein [Bacteroidota bacterium]
MIPEQTLNSKTIIFFDGVCNLCNSSVQFIIKRDIKNKFLFSALQSDTTEQLFKNFNYVVPKTNSPESIVILTKGKFLDKSSAVLTIAGQLGKGWQLFQIFWVFPKPIRDSIYLFVARNRYKWFGKKEACMIPTPELKAKFI